MKINKLVATAIFVVAKSAFAVPFVGVNCRTAIKAPANGSGVLFDEECTTAYVLPPVVGGESRIASLAQSTNLQFCPTVLQARRVSERTMNSADLIAEKIEAMIKDYDPLSQEIVKLRVETSQRKVDKDIDLEVYDLAKEKTETLIDSLVQSKASLTMCRTLGESECEAESDLLKATRKELKEHIVTAEQPATSKYFDSKRKYLRSSSRLQSANKKFLEGIAPALELQTSLLSLNATIFDLSKQYSALEGATGQIVYSVQWGRLLEEYRNLNSNLNISFQPVLIKDGNFTATVRRPTGQNSNVSAVLWTVVPGMERTGPGADVAADVKIGASPKLASQYDIGQTTVGFGNSISGQIALSLSGSCVYFPDGPNTNLSEIDTDSFTTHLVANSELTYEVAARRGYTARYNLASFVKRVEKKTKRGGWFSSKNINSIVEDKDSSDWFGIKFDADAGEFQYSDADQNKITREVKVDLIERALKLVASTNSISSTPPPMPAQPGYTGAGRLAKRMNKACWWNAYCRYGSWTLRALDNAYGRTEAVSDFKSSNNTWVTDQVRGIRIFDRTARLSFQRPEQI